MGGPRLARDQLAAAASWVDRIPVIAKAAGDPDAIARGQALFEDARIGCTTCHSGPKLTNAAIVDVGTGGTFKVPRLVDVVEHAPFIHDGRAATLTDRFHVGGDRHGNTGQLTPAQIADLVAFLESL
jgi:cytochrome c peroxidase